MALDLEAILVNQSAGYYLWDKQDNVLICSFCGGIVAAPVIHSRYHQHIKENDEEIACPRCWHFHKETCISCGCERYHDANPS